jgi:hypothetical protein
MNEVNVKPYYDNLKYLTVISARLAGAVANVKVVPDIV